MIIYAIVPEDELKRLEEIEKKYLEIKSPKTVEISKEKEGEKSDKDSTDELEGMGHDVNIDGPPVVQPLPQAEPSTSTLPANISSVSTTEPLTADELIPFLPKKKHFKARQLLKDLGKTAIFVSKTGAVTINSNPLPNANGILLLKNTLAPLKKAIKGKEEFEKALNEYGLQKYFAKKGVNPPKRKIPKDWWYIGLE